MMRQEKNEEEEEEEEEEENLQESNSCSPRFLLLRISGECCT
jgi:hypothetical protein